MTQWTPLQGLKEYGAVLGRKVGYSAIGWLILYFVSQPFRNTQSATVNIMALFAPLLGALAGLVIGWYLATDSAEDSGTSGVPLWTILTIGSWVAIWAVEALMWLILRWPVEFGGWMVISSAMIMAMVAAIWHASSQE